MSRRSSFIIFIIATIVMMASFVLNFSAVTSPVSHTFAAMQNMYLALTAVIASLLLIKQKYYWLEMLGVAVIAAIIIEVVVLGGALMSMAVFYKIVAIAVYAYWIQLMRFMF